MNQSLWFDEKWFHANGYLLTDGSEVFTLCSDILCMDAVIKVVVKLCPILSGTTLFESSF